MSICKAVRLKSAIPILRCYRGRDGRQTVHLHRVTVRTEDEVDRVDEGAVEIEEEGRERHGAKLTLPGQECSDGRPRLTLT